MKLNEYNQCQLNLIHRWGGGLFGGIILGSNIKDSLKIWDCKIKDDFIGVGGNIESYRELLDESCSYTNTTNELCMISDCTPHEALPVKEDCFRQFFRIVVGDVDVWYNLHSTENELGIKPDPKTKIININKLNPHYNY